MNGNKLQCLMNCYYGSEIIFSDSFFGYLYKSASMSHNSVRVLYCLILKIDYKIPTA